MHVAAAVRLSRRRQVAVAGCPASAAAPVFQQPLLVVSAPPFARPLVVAVEVVVARQHGGRHGRHAPPLLASLTRRQLPHCWQAGWAHTLQQVQHPQLVRRLLLLRCRRRVAGHALLYLPPMPHEGRAAAAMMAWMAARVATRCVAAAEVPEAHAAQQYLVAVLVGARQGWAHHLRLLPPLLLPPLPRRRYRNCMQRRRRAAAGQLGWVPQTAARR